MAQVYLQSYPNTLIIDNWYPPTNMVIEKFLLDYPDDRIVVIEEK